LPSTALSVTFPVVTDPIQVIDLLILLVGRALAAVLFVIFAVDWLVRTRRISPFGATARFFRRAVDPLLEPVERRVVRAGGMPSAAPWWALVAAVAGGILLILLLKAARDIVAEAMAASHSARALYYLLVAWTLGILRLALVVRVIASWLRISPYVRWMRWCTFLTEWMLRPLRRVLPPVGMIDISPLVALLILWAAEGVLRWAW
jgi:YggT family protein